VDAAPDRWQTRRVTAFAIVTTAVLLPLASSMLTAKVVGAFVPRSGGIVGAVAWWSVVIVASTAALLVVDRGARRLLPLAALFRLALVFPDRAPSRYCVALRTGTVRQLTDRLRDGGDLGDTPAEAAENLIVLITALGRHDRRSRRREPQRIGVCLRGHAFAGHQQTLSQTQMSRWNKAKTASEPVQIVTLDEALNASKQSAGSGGKSNAKKTWIYKADNVRDFDWTSSRRFVWDAMQTDVMGKKAMAMSYYAKEAYPIYSKFSTKAVAHTIKTYSKFTIPYPYPVAQSVEASNGMEYPMICFNFGRTEKDGSYSEGVKYGMLGVIIHEVGHNFFPMIINSDERQWSWMDEGLNSFVEYLSEELWDNKFPVTRGPAYTITDYMKLPKDQLEPIMTNSENIIQFGSNAYSKPTTALNILRETIMGREKFDYAFKTYCERWAFKHPTPADFFRTMEDASGVDLDWFWRGWFSLGG
jgi:hypothetical protein